MKVFVSIWKKTKSAVKIKNKMAEIITKLRKEKPKRLKMGGTKIC